MAYVYAHRIALSSATLVRHSRRENRVHHHTMGPGKPRVFSDEQLDVLRAGAQRLVAERRLTQADLGALLGVTQTSAGRFLTSRSSGLSYLTATTLVRSLGYHGVDAFFEAHGVATWQADKEPDPWPHRAYAAQMARLLGMDPIAIGNVIARDVHPSLRRRSPYTWFMLFHLEAMTLAELRREEQNGSRQAETGMAERRSM